MRIEIAIELETPVIPGAYLTLDAVLYAGLGRVLDEPPDPERVPLCFSGGLPLASAAYFDLPIGHITPMSVGVQLTRVCNLSEIADRRAPITAAVKAGSGKYQCIQSAARKAQLVDRVRWYAEIESESDADRILELIGGLPGVGAYARLGFGMFRRSRGNLLAEVTPAVESPVLDAHSLPRRPIPVGQYRAMGGDPGAEMAYCTARAPYYDRGAATVCAVPALSTRLT